MLKIVSTVILYDVKKILSTSYFTMLKLLNTVILYIEKYSVKSYFTMLKKKYSVQSYLMLKKSNRITNPQKMT